MRLNNTLFTLLFIAITPVLRSQPGTLDPTFGTTGYVITDQVGDGRSIAVYADGRSVVISASGGASAIGMFEADGSPSIGFGTNGWLIGLGYVPIKVLLQADGKILVAGAWNAGGVVDMIVARYNGTGTPDASFGVAGIARVDLPTNETCLGMVLLADGRILMTGSVIDPDQRALLAMFNTNGTLDASFGEEGLVKWLPTPTSTSTEAQDAAIQNDGSIVVACNHGAIIANNLLVRFTASGDLDETFNGIGHVYVDLGSNQDDIMNVQLDASQRIICMASNSDAGSAHSGSLARLTANGALDPSFGIGGVVALNTASTTYGAAAMLVSSDDQILITGTTGGTFSPDRELFLARYTSEGALDPLFGDAGYTLVDLPYRENGQSIVPTSDGRIMVCGRSQESGASGYILLARFWYDSGVGITTHAVSGSELNAFPVPAMNTLILDREQPLPRGTRIEVRDAAGRIAPVTFQLNGTRATLDVAHLPAGLYSVTVVASGERSVARFVKE